MHTPGNLLRYRFNKNDFMGSFFFLPWDTSILVITQDYSSAYSIKQSNSPGIADLDMQFHKRPGTALCFLGNARPKEWDAETWKLPSTGMPAQPEDWDPGSNSLLALIGKICQSPWNGARGNCFQPALLLSHRTAQQVQGKQWEDGPWNKCQGMKACLSPLLTAAQIRLPIFQMFNSKLNSMEEVFLD